MLTAILLFYMSKGLVMLAYNMLARKTARSQRFFRGVDILSAVITIWSLANIVVVAMSMYQGSSPPVSTRDLSTIYAAAANLF